MTGRGQYWGLWVAQRRWCGVVLAFVFGYLEGWIGPPPWCLYLGICMGIELGVQWQRYRMWRRHCGLD